MIGIAVATGAVLVLIAGWGLSATSTESFCISCHEMRVYAHAEYKNSGHDFNRTGKRVTCPDCHVPNDFFPKLWRKIRASQELYHHLTGKLDTPEKYEQQRYQMALNVWREMKANDSRNCRDCHDSAQMNPQMQSEDARDSHLSAVEEGLTCIDCHYAIVHEEPDGELVPEDL